MPSTTLSIPKAVLGPAIQRSLSLLPLFSTLSAAQRHDQVQMALDASLAERCTYQETCVSQEAFLQLTALTLKAIPFMGMMTDQAHEHVLNVVMAQALALQDDRDNEGDLPHAEVRDALRRAELSLGEGSAPDVRDVRTLLTYSRATLDWPVSG